MRLLKILFFMLMLMVVSLPIQSQAITYEIESLAYSPDGSEIAVVGRTPICMSDHDPENYAITILDSVTGETIRAIGNEGCAINSVSWSPDGLRIATSSWDGTAFVWDATTGEMLSRFAGSGYGAFSLRNVEWNPLDDRIVVQSASGRTTATWNASTGNGIGPLVFDVATFAVASAKWSPDGNRLAIGTMDEKIEIYDMTPANASLEYWPLLLRFDVGPFWEIAWSPDGSQIATTAGLEIQVFDADSGLPVKTLSGSTNNLLDLAWSPDASRIAAGGMDGVLRVWNLASETEIAAYDHIAPIYTVDWHPNDGQIAFSGLTVPDGNLVDIVPIPRLCDTNDDICNEDGGN